MISKLENQEPVLKELLDVERQLIEVTDEDLVDVNPVQERTSCLVRQYFNLYSLLQERQSLLADVYEHTKAFSESSKELEDWVPKAIGDVDSVDITGAEPSVKKKLELLQVGLVRLCLFWWVYIFLFIVTNC